MKRNRPYIPAEIRILPMSETDLLTESTDFLMEANQGNDIIISW